MTWYDKAPLLLLLSEPSYTPFTLPLYPPPGKSLQLPSSQNRWWTSQPETPSPKEPKRHDIKTQNSRSYSMNRNPLVGLCARVVGAIGAADKCTRPEHPAHGGVMLCTVQCRPASACARKSPPRGCTLKKQDKTRRCPLKTESGRTKHFLSN